MQNAISSLAALRTHIQKNHLNIPIHRDQLVYISSYLNNQQASVLRLCKSWESGNFVPLDLVQRNVRVAEYYVLVGTAALGLTNLNFNQ